MQISVERAGYVEIESMRDLYRHEAHCQIVCDSLLRRGLADAYLLLVDGRRAGYGGVRNKYDPGQLMEFYTLPSCRGLAQPMFRELLTASGATSIEAQTNMPLMVTMLFDAATDITQASILFADSFVSRLECPGAHLRLAEGGDRPPAAGDECILECDGEAVATGGFLCHYNPPYGDVYMSVVESARRKGFGSYIVQELKRVCYEAGRRPSARCNTDNVASRRTLQKAGFEPCGRMLVGKIRSSL